MVQLRSVLSGGATAAQGIGTVAHKTSMMPG